MNKRNLDYFCKCGNKIHWRTYLYGNKKCLSCSIKKRNYLKQDNPNYKDGSYIKKYFCIDCNKKICLTSSLYGNGRCKPCSLLLQKGKNNPNWQGGLSFEEYGQEFDNSLKEQVRFRDKYKCQLCDCSQLENGRQLDVHHKDYNKKNNFLNNLISLCKRCHMKTNWHRKFWIQYFRELLWKI